MCGISGRAWVSAVSRCHLPGPMDKALGRKADGGWGFRRVIGAAFVCRAPLAATTMPSCVMVSA